MKVWQHPAANNDKKKWKQKMQTWLFLQPCTEQWQSKHAESEDQDEDIVTVPRLHPELVCVSPERHVDGAEQPLRLLEELLVLQWDRSGVDGQRLAALL